MLPFFMSEYTDSNYSAMYEVSCTLLSGQTFSSIESAPSEKEAMLKVLRDADDLGQIFDIAAVEL